MINVIVELSKYLILTLMIIYTFHCRTLARVRSIFSYSTHSPISLTIFTNTKELSSIHSFISQSNFPSRLLLTIYIIHSSQSGCFYHYLSQNTTQCLPKFIYPINRLRNLAIQRVFTSHFLILDMDMFPACINYLILMICSECI